MCVCMYTYYAKVHTHARAHTCIHRAGDKCGWGSEIYTYMHSCMRTYIHTLTCVDAEDDGGYDERVADKRYAFCYRGVLATKRHQHLPHAAAVSRSVDAQTHRCFFKHAWISSHLRTITKQLLPCFFKHALNRFRFPTEKDKD